MNTVRICGYLVVRLPHLSMDPAGRGAFTPTAPQLSGVFYGGIDRMQWFDVDEDFYSRTLPEELVRLRERIRGENMDASGIYLCRDLTTTKIMLEYSNRAGTANEIIALRSPKLAKIKGEIEAANIDWRGFDIATIGEASLLLEGIFSNPERFARFRSELNGHGLFRSEGHVPEYIQSYMTAVNEGAAELVWSDPALIDTIAIGAAN